MRDFAPNSFDPLSSGPPVYVAASFLQQFLRKTSPRLFANTATVNPAGQAFSSNVQLTQILQLTLPVPAPTAVLLQAQGAVTRGRFEPTTANPAEVAESGVFDLGPRTVGRFVVEWGTGEARGFLFTDLTPGTLQLPSAIYVAVFAFVDFGDPQLASAVVMPEAVFAEAHATFTTSVLTEFSQDFQARRQPFARAMSVDFGVAEPFPAPGLQLDVLGNWQAATVARWVVPEPVQPDVLSAPVPVSDVPLAGSVDNFTLRFSGLPAPPPDLDAQALPAVRDGATATAGAVSVPPYAAANLIQTIRV